MPETGYETLTITEGILNWIFYKSELESRSMSAQAAVELKKVGAKEMTDAELMEKLGYTRETKKKVKEVTAS